MPIRARLSHAFHRYLRVPYTLNVHEFHKPPKPKATYVLIHGIGNSLHSWDEVVEKMPKDVRIIGIDLLGFGKSPKPEWAIYDAKTQARSVGLTLLGLRLVQQPILVGHSLGALVAVEVAKRYSLIPKRLVLCSPPFYSPRVDTKKVGSPDDMLRTIYSIAKKNPERLAKFSSMAVKLGLANKTLDISQDNIPSYIATLESSIINQTSLEDVAKLKLPIDIFYGSFDPVVIKKHITGLAEKMDNVSATRLNGAHEIVGGYAKTLSHYLSELRP
jgi:pimeloyl-ACP methyl ester carboxylesterase